eukprot:TRINITY_DN4649_c0_g1_i8.p1 TRINITY_DN4649_c0_g1~~TRINITY_DN4649_c0_g1_i8.p1  ORF type:complete len:670 (+),score=121.29 TRINITY_DN4649_c0_g1_i8:59-2068(+)
MSDSHDQNASNLPSGDLSIGQIASQMLIFMTFALTCAMIIYRLMHSQKIDYNKPPSNAPSPSNSRPHKGEIVNLQDLDDDFRECEIRSRSSSRTSTSSLQPSRRTSEHGRESLHKVPLIDIDDDLLDEYCSPSSVAGSLEDQINQLRRKSVHERKSTDSTSPSMGHDLGATKSHGSAVEIVDHDDNWPFDGKETYSFKDHRQTEVVVNVMDARNLKVKGFDTSNPFCIIRLLGQERRTSTVHDTINPDWSERFRFTVDTTDANVHIQVVHEDFYSQSDNDLGHVRIPLQAILSQPSQVDWYSLGNGCGQIRLELKATPIVQDKVCKDSFSLIKMLGKGNYGKVFLVSRADDKTLYAMKVMRKDVILSREKVTCVKMEKTVLKEVKSPFLLDLKYSFQTNTKLYLVLEYMNGGELFFHLKVRDHFSEADSRFYLAEIVLGIEALHENYIIYRDLKPENVMIDHHGHIKLTDFGLCKKLERGEKTKTFCGTPEYFAPEILLGHDYDYAVDWWAVGILAYELMTGKAPFYHRNKSRMYNNIIQGELDLPSTLSDEAVSLLQGLLDKDPITRLGSGPSRSQEVKTHPFFKGISWKDANCRRLVPPIVPCTESPLDVSYFDPQLTCQTPRDTFVETTLSNSHQQLFAGFSYDPSAARASALHESPLPDFGSLDA